MDRIIFCIFLEEDLDVYQQLLLKYFPSEESIEQQSHQQERDVTEPNQAKGNDGKTTEEEGEGKSGDTEGVISRVCRGNSVWFILWYMKKAKSFNFSRTQQSLPEFYCCSCCCCFSYLASYSISLSNISCEATT